MEILKTDEGKAAYIEKLRAEARAKESNG